MALDPILWALKDAPVKDAGERLILTVLAEAADEDGTNAYPSQATIAKRALCTDRSVRNKLAAMEARGLIKRGDQSAVLRFPADRRPVVWDVAIPHSWWGVRWERMNETRVTRGQKPLRPVDRPDIPSAEAFEEAKSGRKEVPAVKSDAQNGRNQVPAGTDFRPEPDSATAGTEFRSDRNHVPTTHPNNPPQDPPPSSGAASQESLPFASDTTVAPDGATETTTKAPKSKAKKGTRLPESFVLTDEMRTWGSENAPDVDGPAEHEKFCDYWRGVPGQRGVKLDWPATWRNWMRKAQEDAAHRKQVAERRLGGRRGYSDVETWGEDDPEKARQEAEQFDIEAFFARGKAVGE